MFHLPSWSLSASLDINVWAQILAKYLGANTNGLFGDHWSCKPGAARRSWAQLGKEPEYIIIRRNTEWPGEVGGSYSNDQLSPLKAVAGENGGRETEISGRDKKFVSIKYLKFTHKIPNINIHQPKYAVSGRMNRQLMYIFAPAFEISVGYNCANN